MNKEQAINLINQKFDLNLNSNNTNWSNINSNGIWSMEPNTDRQNRTLYLLLNNNYSNKIHAFEIPANDRVYDRLYIRIRKGVFRLVFNVIDTEFIEDFYKFLQRIY